MAEERSCLRLGLGLTRLEEWAEQASQVEKNLAYKALFSVADGSVFRMYDILDDVNRAREFFVLVRENLVIKVCFHQSNAFGIVYIGSPSGAPGFDLGIDNAA